MFSYTAPEILRLRHPQGWRYVYCPECGWRCRRTGRKVKGNFKGLRKVSEPCQCDDPIWCHLGIWSDEECPYEGALNKRCPRGHKLRLSPRHARQTRVPYADVQEMLRLFEAGYSGAEVARLTGWAPSTVTVYLHRHGLHPELRPQTIRREPRNAELVNTIRTLYCDSPKQFRTVPFDVIAKKANLSHSTLTYYFQRWNIPVRGSHVTIMMRRRERALWGLLKTQFRIRKYCLLAASELGLGAIDQIEGKQRIALYDRALELARQSERTAA